MRDREARQLIADRDAIEESERARYTGPDGRYLEQPPSEEALRDLVGCAQNAYGSWMRPSPGGYWLDVVAMGRELLAARETIATLRAGHTDGTVQRADVVYTRGYRAGREEAEAATAEALRAADALADEADECWPDSTLVARYRAARGAR